MAFAGAQQTVVTPALGGQNNQSADQSARAAFATIP